MSKISISKRELFRKLCKWPRKGDFFLFYFIKNVHHYLCCKEDRLTKDGNNLLEDLFEVRYISLEIGYECEQLYQHLFDNNAKLSLGIPNSICKTVTFAHLSVTAYDVGVGKKGPWSYIHYFVFSFYSIDLFRALSSSLHNFNVLRVVLFYGTYILY